MATALTPYAAALEQTTAGRTTIPFDYSFRFTLEGVRGAKYRQKFEVSVGADFVAVSIGYGFVPAIADKRIPLLTIGGKAAQPVVAAGGIAAAFRSITLDDVVSSINFAVASAPSLAIRNRLAAALRKGIRVNPDLVDRALTSPFAPVSAADLESLFELAGTPGDVQFLYALSDPASGREFQSEPLLSTAGLGSGEGERPFRQFPMPIRFEQRSQMQMEITEVDRQPGELHVVLHGYKVFGALAPSAGDDAGVARRRRRS